MHDLKFTTPHVPNPVNDVVESLDYIAGALPVGLMLSGNGLRSEVAAAAIPYLPAGVRKASWACTFHSNFIFRSVNAKSGLVIVTKIFTNRRYYVHRPRKLFTSRWFCG